MDELRMKDREDASVATPVLPEAPDGAGAFAGEPNKRKPGAKSEQPEQTDAPFTVAMIKKGAKDSRGKPIDEVFFKRDSYAVYQSGKELAIQFSDDAKKANTQIKTVSPLIPIRNRIQFMCLDYPRFDCYRLQIAEALHLGLEGRADQGRRLLNGVVDDCQNMRAIRARRCYMKHASITAILIAIAAVLLAAALFYYTGLWTADVGKSLTMMLLATTGGAIGALLSIAIAIRGRAVELDGDVSANRLDARVRVVIGVISAGALYLILAAGLFTLGFGEVQLTGADMDWGVALLIGIAAGFLERLVSDLLEGRREPNSSTAEPGTEGRPAG